MLKRSIENFLAGKCGEISREWKIPVTAVFDQKVGHACNVETHCEKKLNQKLRTSFETF